MTAFHYLWTNGRGGARAMVVEIDIGTRSRKSLINAGIITIRNLKAPLDGPWASPVRICEVEAASRRFYPLDLVPPPGMGVVWTAAARREPRYRCFCDSVGCI